MISQAPLIETDRLILRNWQKEDLARWYDVLQQEGVTRFLGGTSGTMEDVWRRIAAGVGSWSLMGFGRWAVTMKESNQLVGDVGLFNSWRALEPKIGEEPEIGWVFSPEVQGCGIASEAALAVLGWAEASLAPTRIWAIVSPENEASLRLASRLGFEPIGETLYHDEPTVVLERPAWAGCCE